MKDSSDAPVSGLSTTHQQNLQPLGIYTVNRTLDEIKDVAEIKKCIKKALAPTKGNEGDLSVVPVLFNKHKRTFRQAAVASRRLKIQNEGVDQDFEDKTKELFERIRNEKDNLDGNRELYKSFKSAIREAQSQILFDAFADKFSLLEALIEKEPQAGFLSSEIVELLHVLYFSIEYSRTDALAGILYTRIEQRSSEPAIDYFRGHMDPCSTKEEYSPGRKLDAIVGNFHFCNGNLDEENSYQQSDKSLSRILKELGNLLYASSGEKDDEVFTVPIWDTWYAGRSYGGLWGVLVFRFPKNEDNSKAVHRTNLVRNFVGRCEALSGQLFSAGVAAIAQDDLNPPYDLPDHFLRTLTWVQDWECAAAYTYKGHDKKKMFCYRRIDIVSAQIWKRCEESPCCSCVLDSKGGDISLGFGTESDIWDRKFVPELTEAEISTYGNYRFEFQFANVSLLPDNQTERKCVEEVIVRRQKTVLGLLALRLREKRYALRQAVSGIMGRNLSHNIGSHVLARYSREIEGDGTEGEQPFDHRGEFLAFLQERMDFLADVATADRAFWSQSLPLRETLLEFDYDNSKKRYENEYGEGGKPILLRYITGKTGLNATVKYKSEETYFACPSGSVGTHALYVILENIIRNSARHGSAGGGFVTLEVSLCEQDHDSDSDLLKLVKLEIVDSRSPVSRQVTLTLENPAEAATGVTVCYKAPTADGANRLQDAESNPAGTFAISTDGGANAASADHSEALVPVVATLTGSSLVLTFNKGLDPDSVPAKESFCVTADDAVVSVSKVSIPRLDERINDILKEPILAVDGKPKAENWGIREMQICAHYLRGFSLFDLESPPDKDPAVLTAGCHEGKLKYIIYLQRAKRLAVVVKDESTQEDQDKSEDTREDESVAETKLKQLGILRIGTTGEPNWKEIGHDEIGGYDFLVVQNGVTLPKGSRGRAEARMPVRSFDLSRSSINKLLWDAERNPLWMEELHRRWTKEVRQDHPQWEGKCLLGIAISRGDALKPLPSSTWPNGGNYRMNVMILASSPEKNKEDYDEDTKPLASGAKDWLDELKKGNALAAAWIDHGKKDDFTDLGLSGVQTPSGGRLWISAETAKSGYPHARDLSALFNDPTGPKWELLAAAVPQIAVLDERVQNAGRQNSPVSGICLRDLWHYMGVWTPALPKEGSDDQDDCDLDVPNFGRIQAFLGIRKEHLDRCPIDILVVHLTILERLANDRNKEALSRTLKCLCDDTWASEAEVVIVTGRGVPAVARSAATDHSLLGVRYLPISALLESLVSVPSKLSLMRTLWSAGVPN